jgi:hypothetical protein
VIALAATDLLAVDFLWKTKAHHELKGKFLRLVSVGGAYIEHFAMCAAQKIGHMAQRGHV